MPEQPTIAQAPQTPAPTGRRDPAPDIVALDTPDERARHCGLILEFNTKYSERTTPTMSKPYPLTPGTLKQTRDICIRCGRGLHMAIQCPVPDSQKLSESEHSMRAAILGTLWRPSHAGTVPGTPTPGARFARNTAQLEEEEEVVQHVEYYKLENEEAPAMCSAPGAGHLSFYETSETIYVSPDAGFGLATDDDHSYLPSPEVVDLYEIFDKTKYKENLFQVWAQSPEREPTPQLQTGPTNDSPNEETGSEPNPGEHVPLRRSRWLRKEPAKIVLDESENLFWLDRVMIEKLECWIGMGTECAIKDARELPESKEVHADPVEVQRVKTESEDEFLERMWRLAGQEREEQTQREILLTELVEQDAKGPAGIFALESEPSKERHPLARRRLPTPSAPESAQSKDPFNRDRVADILNRVTIGDDLSPKQKQKVRDLIGEYADVFARSLSEVLPVDFAQIKLDIPIGTQFPRRAGQKRLTEPQREWLYKTLDDMEQAKIIAKVPQDQVQAVSPTNIVPKPGGAELPSLASLRRMANEQCRLYNLPVMWPDVEVEGPEEAPSRSKTKYRLVHNFAAVNKVTQLRPFPMGDLLSMQRKVAGHQWISVMDFLARFNAIPVAPESVPYTGFYVDGRSYYVYL
ncbi:Retrovirus-related Pol polyprotein from transposon [Ceratobasidium sp. AG-Ba]|nr:Retrovirus-related Pol polyprotein from transposon [Ceratobasidium sp. AG-Ba]